MNETTTIRNYRATKDLIIHNHNERVLTAGKIYQVRDFGAAGRVFTNDQGREHFWPHDDTFDAYFEEIPKEEAPQEMYKARWSSADEPDEDWVDYYDRQALLETFPWLQTYLEGIYPDDPFSVEINYDIRRLRIERMGS